MRSEQDSFQTRPHPANASPTAGIPDRPTRLRVAPACKGFPAGVFAASCFFAPPLSLEARTDESAPEPVLQIDSGMPIYVSSDEPPALLRAVEDLQRDFRNVMGHGFPVIHDPGQLAEEPAIVILGPSTDLALGQNRWVDGREEHRVFVEEADGHSHVVLQGADPRGAIYAVYSFSEEFLGIPPLWVWTSRPIERRDRIEIPLSTDLHFEPPDVKWRTWFPNDQDYLIPWKAISGNRDLLAETFLRLKLNSWDTGSVLNESVTGISADARTARDRGIAVMSTHTSPLGTRVEETRWNNYWINIRGESPPDLTLANTDALLDFWRHSVTTILAEEVETIWTVTFRGHGDLGFWHTYPDAPDSDSERAEVIESMLEHQVRIVAEEAGDDAVMRVPLYNEMSDYFLAGLLEPPEGPAIIWNLVSARRDHYPPEDVFDMTFPEGQPIGLYFNIQFTSTGSHVAQGEGPWKMEENHRIIDSLTPELPTLSMVNVGNVREFVMELEAHARMMWDFDGYDSNAFLENFAGRYFGAAHAREVAELYRDFFLSYWEQRPPTLEGFERQFFFHDLRYSRAMRDILARLENANPSVEPLGTSDFYRIDPAYSGASNTLEAILAGTGESIAKLDNVTARAETLLDEIDERRRPFFNHHLRAQAGFMLNVNRSLRSLALAMRDFDDPWLRENHLAAAHGAYGQARAFLRETETGRFEDWYPRPGQRDIFHLTAIESRLDNLYTAPPTPPVTGAFFDNLNEHPLLWETDFSSAEGWSNVDGTGGYIDTENGLLGTASDAIAGPYATLTSASLLGEPVESDSAGETTTALYFNARFEADSPDDTLWLRFRANEQRGEMPNIAAGLRGDGTLLALGIGSHERLAEADGHVSVATRNVPGVDISLTSRLVQYRLLMQTRADSGSLILQFEQFHQGAGAWQRIDSIAVEDFRTLLGGSPEAALDRLSVFFRTPGTFVSDLAITQRRAEAPPGGFSDWRHRRFSPTDLSDESLSGPYADPDADGVVNLLEFALGGDPHAPGSAPLPILESGGGAEDAAFRFTRPKAAAEAVRYDVQQSGDLTAWETLWSSSDHPYGRIAATEPVNVTIETSSGARFVRLKVILKEDSPAD